ncbi:MAG: Ig-like domain-containing protein [Candidatus Krumholzibacteriia bacterium]
MMPPWLVAAYPESLATGVGPIDELQLGFSEKMDRQDAFRWLTLYPRRTIRSTSWHGARVATVRLDEPLPADTVVVVEIAPGMRDSHKVPQARGRTYVFATGDSIYDGELTGQLVLDDRPLGGAVVEILAAGPDSVRLEQRPVLRRAMADSGGAWRLPWLPANGDRWLLRAYQDGNHDRRPGENEAQRLWPDTLRLVTAAPRLDTGLRVLYNPTTPGRLRGRLDGRPAAAGPVLAFILAIGEEDTGFVAAPQPQTARAAAAVPDTGAFVLAGAPPGLDRAVFFVDLDGDSLWTAVGDPADTLWALEPWALVDSVAVEPGLETTIAAPVWTDTLTTWPAPPPVPAAAAVDTTAGPPPEE